MKTASEILDHVGRDRAASALGVDVRRVNNAASDGVLPAAWFDALEKLAGGSLDRTAFTFKPRAIPRDGSETSGG